MIVDYEYLHRAPQDVKIRCEPFCSVFLL
jgi:hypothetical protein